MERGSTIAQRNAAAAILDLDMIDASLGKDGFQLVPAVLSADDCDVVIAQISPSLNSQTGTRCLLTQPWCASIANRLRGHAIVSELVPGDYLAVQCNYFEKSVSRNWLVAMHQDLSIPVAKHVEHPSLRGWSEKEGSLFVQGPPEVLEKLIAIRLHLDDCGPEDGPLRVLPRSHARGRIESEAICTERSAIAEVTCVVKKGGALVMRPLLLHASSKSSGTSRRRVLHFVFGPKDLPLGLQWKQ